MVYVNIFIMGMYIPTNPAGLCVPSILRSSAVFVVMIDKAISFLRVTIMFLATPARNVQIGASVRVPE